jgi:hypothetical protein
VDGRHERRGGRDVPAPGIDRDVHLSALVVLQVSTVWVIHQRNRQNQCGIRELPLLHTRLSIQKRFTIAMEQHIRTLCIKLRTAQTDRPRHKNVTQATLGHITHHRITLPFQCCVLATGWKQSHITATAQTLHYTSAGSYLS